MGLPCLKAVRRDEPGNRSRLYVLEVRSREASDGDPIAWLLVQCTETVRFDERDRSVHEASIELHYERILPKYANEAGGGGCFYGGYSRGRLDGPVVSLLSAAAGEGSLFLDLPRLEGQRIGTYLMNEIVVWAKQWPTATVAGVSLLPGQAGPENKDRRNRFYEQFGLVFDYTDVRHVAGESRPMPAASLTPTDSWRENLRERHLHEYLADTLRAKEKAEFEFGQRERAIKDLVHDRQRAEQSPLRWAMKRMWWRYGSALMGSVVLGLIAVLVWRTLQG